MIDKAKLLQGIANYLTDRFIGDREDLPGNECLREARYIWDIIEPVIREDERDKLLKLLRDSLVLCDSSTCAACQWFFKSLGESK